MIETKYVDEIGTNLIVCPNCGSTKEITMDGVFADKPMEHIAVELNRKTEIETGTNNIGHDEMKLTVCFKCYTCNHYFAYILKKSADDYVKVDIDSEPLDDDFDEETITELR